VVTKPYTLDHNPKDVNPQLEIINPESFKPEGYALDPESIIVNPKS
jgi:uncharacterized protein (DUF2249 family)